MRSPPRITGKKTVAQSRLFTIEEVGLEFGNGVEASFERLVGARGAVMIVPVSGTGADATLMMVREYAVGLERYELGFPKGRIDAGESAPLAANRELMEEIGYRAGSLELMTQVSVAPAYASFMTSIFLAQDLCEASAQGDEPEPLELVRWPLHDARALLERDDFTESRSRLAVLMLLDTTIRRLT